MWLGLVVAGLCEVSALALLITPAAYLLPLARFPGFIWMICVGALLPNRRRTAPGSARERA
jgi:hypothetical protein